VAIEVDNVTKQYGPVRALLNVSARFDSGKVSMVLGANGSGKSTLLAIVGTLSRPSFGTVRHGDLGATPHDVRASLGWLGHDSLCYGDLTGRENLRFAARLYGRDESTVAKAVERFRLGPFVDRAFRTYSRGQRQRVALARALLHEPRLLLLDEPTTGLDKAGIELLREVVREEAARKVTVVVVTHDATFLDVADSTLTLERGKVVTEEAGASRAPE
jgi:heme exporter protein A